MAWQKGETLSVAIGQGFNNMTPLQICLMTAAIASGGSSPVLVRLLRERLEAELSLQLGELAAFAGVGG